jgi:predicted DNA-binding protein
MAKKTRFAFRTTDEFKERIARVAEKLGLDQAVIGEAALEAVIAYVEKWGELTIPIQIERREKKVEDAISPTGSSGLPHGRRSSFPTTPTGLNEPEGDYRAKKKEGRP